LGKLDQGLAITIGDQNVFNILPHNDINVLLSQIQGGQGMYNNIQQVFTCHQLVNDLNCDLWFVVIFAILVL
jgi:hypothetical protein